MALEDNIVDALDKLSTYEGLLDTRIVWSHLVDSGTVGSMCRIGIYLMFFTMMCAMFKAFIFNGHSFKFRDYWVIVGKTFLVLIFFGVLYSEISSILINISSAMVEDVAGGSLRDFRAQLRQYFFTLQTPPASEDANILERIWDGAVRFISRVWSLIKFLNNPLPHITLAAVTSVLIIFVYLFMSLGHFFVVVALTMAPLCMALSILFPAIGRAWASFLIASIFFALAVGIGLGVIVGSGIIPVASGEILNMKPEHAILMLVLFLVYLTFVPFVIAQIFKVSCFGFTGRLLGWIYGITVVLLPLTIMSQIVNGMLGEKFKATKGITDSLPKPQKAS